MTKIRANEVAHKANIIKKSILYRNACKLDFKIRHNVPFLRFKSNTPYKFKFKQQKKFRLIPSKPHSSYKVEY